MTNNEIRKFLSLPEIEKEFEILMVDSIDDAIVNTLLFINRVGVDLSEYDYYCYHCLFLVDESYHIISSERNDFIRIPNPKYKFCKVVEEFNLPSRYQYSGLESTIGYRCKIDSSAIIGGEDFSPVLTDNCTLVQFPQMGGVEIGDDVVIKYNTMIGKGTFGNTVIGDNTMIDFGCQIGHNCEIGKSCIIAAGTIIGGSTTIGDHTTIGIGAKIRNGLHIGNNVSIGMGSVVIHDVPDGSCVVGNPARIIDHKPIFDKGGLV